MNQQTTQQNPIQISLPESEKPCFETELTKSIDDVFSALGENVKQAVYRILQTQYHMSKDQIPSKLETFTDAIDSIFGEAAKLLELKILESLQRKTQGFRYKPNNSEVLFSEWVTAFRKYIDWQAIIPKA